MEVLVSFHGYFCQSLLHSPLKQVSPPTQEALRFQIAHRKIERRQLHKLCAQDLVEEFAADILPTTMK